ncbi:L,D-transpeptidase family protein [Streptomyces fradiae]|uniref:L,D-transpeptidase family protein n=1 Tax=Streptomyces fradiae TaxID=1906 RepID=UPI002942D830|nr:L,D-transpeptidase family protein [Streptomyces fradiae]WOI62798.1 L,D-transpeptidase family protein [Streptomyces fradiae]
MHRRFTAIRRGALAAAALALATGCTAQAVGAAGAGPSPDAPSSASASPSAAPSPAGASPSGSASPSDPASASPSPSAAASSPAPSSSAPSPSYGDDKPSASASALPGGKVLMAKGMENEQVRELQARLRQVGYFDRGPTAFYGSLTADAVAAFQTKRGLSATGSVDETTWTKLLGMTRKPTANELRPPTSNALDTPDPRCMTGRVLCISKESRTLAWMIDGRVVSAMDVRFGSVNTPTREGTFKVDRKERTWTSTLYHSEMPYSMFFSGGQAVHYSADFAARGYNGASHGCVNVRDEARLAKVFEQVRVGDKVVVHW